MFTLPIVLTVAFILTSCCPTARRSLYLSLLTLTFFLFQWLQIPESFYLMAAVASMLFIPGPAKTKSELAAQTPLNS